jgi:predicted methyltransferase
MVSRSWQRTAPARHRRGWRVAGVLLALLESASVVAAATPAATHSDRATASHSFADVDYWSKIFDDPSRDAWQKPRALLAALALRPGMTVADLGAGTGYFSRYLAEIVGPTGTVLAVEVEPNLVAHLRARAEREDHANVVPLLASTDNPRLPAGGVDLVLVVDTYHHFDHRQRYLPRLHGALRRGGRVAIIDWKPGDLPQGPPPDHKLPREQVIEEMRTAGFALVDDIDLLPYQYRLIFQPDIGSGSTGVPAGGAVVAALVAAGVAERRRAARCVARGDKPRDYSATGRDAGATQDMHQLERSECSP